MKRKLDPSIQKFSSLLEEAFVDGPTANERHRQRLIFREAVREMRCDKFETKSKKDRARFIEHTRVLLENALRKAHRLL